MSSGLSRRGLFSLFARPLRASGEAVKAVRGILDTSSAANPSPAVPPQEMLAVIQGRHCIALTSFCSVCIEHCPVPGALISEHLMPMVMPDTCTGCGICHQVCPAPENAVLMLPRRRPSNSKPAPP